MLAPASDERTVCVHLQNQKPFNMQTLVGILFPASTRLTSSPLLGGDRRDCQRRLRRAQIAIGQCQFADVEPDSGCQLRQPWHSDRLCTLSRQRDDIDRLLVQRAKG